MQMTKLATMLFGATLFVALGTTTASAMDKCGAGKCGNAKPAQTMKCGAGKCGGNSSSQASSKPAMKCGAGKCG